MKELKDMSIMELMEYWDKDWEREDSRLEREDGHMKEWESAYGAATKRASIGELIQACDKIDKEEIEGEPWWNVRTRLSYAIVGDLYDRLATVEKTIELFLKEFGDQPAKITIAQLNRLKGGL